MNTLTKAYFIYDTIFVFFFCIIGILIYHDNLFVVSWICATLLLQYPLFKYIFDFTNPQVIKTNEWYARHFFIPLFYVVLRLVSYVVLFIVVLTDTSGFDLLHELRYMHRNTLIVMLILLACMAISVCLGVCIAFRHVKYIADNMSGYEINAAIVNSNAVTTQTNIIRNIAHVDFHNVRKIYAVPNDRELFTKMLTKTAHDAEHLNIIINLNN